MARNVRRGQYNEIIVMNIIISNNIFLLFISNEFIGVCHVSL
ncbi:hypothetical protein YPPY54_0871, partial [Yersinia pestis PY-54]